MSFLYKLAPKYTTSMSNRLFNCEAAWIIRVIYDVNNMNWPVYRHSYFWQLSWKIIHMELASKWIPIYEKKGVISTFCFTSSEISGFWDRKVNERKGEKRLSCERQMAPGMMLQGEGPKLQTVPSPKTIAWYFWLGD